MSPSNKVQSKFIKDDAMKESHEQILIATKEMCIHCFDVILQNLWNDSKTIIQASLLDFIPPETECPLFVTWDKKHSSSSDYRLRGCIGTLAPRPLRQALTDYAVVSAFRDHRFHPIQKDEVCHLRVGVSLLVKYEVCNDCFDWEVGIHGIIIKFYFSGRHYSATFLPEVAGEQGWDHGQTISNLVRKAGYHDGEITEDLLAAIHCTRYQSSKYKLTFDEYVETTGKDPTCVDANTETPRGKNWHQFFHR